MQLYHDDQFAGHWGIDKTLELLRRKFYWEHMVADVREYIGACPQCQGKAISNHKPYGKLEPLPVPTRPWHQISLDWITHLPTSCIGTDEFDSILVVVCRMTKMAVFIPTRSNTTAEEFARLFHKYVELWYGTPKGVVSDRDSRITSKFWAEVCYYSLIKRRMSTAFHPQTDGQTEIINRILENYLRAYANAEKNNWASLLPSAQWAYNNSQSASTGMTPFRALYGYDPDLHIDFIVANDNHQGEVPAT